MTGGGGIGAAEAPPSEKRIFFDLSSIEKIL